MKSQEIGGILLYELATQSTKNNEIYEIYNAGTKSKQSRIVFDECKLMLKGSPLEPKFKLGRDIIKHIKTGSFIQPLNKDDGQSGDGTNIAVLSLDEYHQHKTTDFYDLFQGANTKESLLIIITTAGTDLTYPCYTQEYKYCSSVLSGEVINDEYLIDICEVEEDDDIDIERNWWKANPIRMSYAEGRKKIRDTYMIAKEVPDKMVSFKTKCLNQWVHAQKNSYIDMNKFENCMPKKAIEFSLKGLDVYVGIDVSAKIDLTSVTFEIPYLMEDGTIKYIVFCKSFVPNDKKLREHQRVDKQPFNAWFSKGYIKVTNSDIVDQKVIIDYILARCKSEQWNIKAICVDPHNSSLLQTTFDDMGYNVFEISQGHKSLNDATVHLREQIYLNNVLFDYDPCTMWQFRNAIITESQGWIKVDKGQSIKRIDCVDSTICSHKLAMMWKPYEKGTSIEEKILSKEFIM